MSRAALVGLVESEGFRVLATGSLAEARAAVQRESPDIALIATYRPPSTCIRAGLGIARR